MKFFVCTVTCHRKKAEDRPCLGSTSIRYGLANSAAEWKSRLDAMFLTRWPEANEPGADIRCEAVEVKKSTLLSFLNEIEDVDSSQDAEILESQFLS